MTTKHKTKKLAKFGAQVLALMEKHRRWSADTLDEIALIAEDSGLAGSNSEAKFERTEDGKL